VLGLRIEESSGDCGTLWRCYKMLVEKPGKW
jgi:hypothetical protein